MYPLYLSCPFCHNIGQLSDKEIYYCPKTVTDVRHWQWNTNLVIQNAGSFTHIYQTNKYECTLDQELQNAAAYAPGTLHVHPPGQHFSAWSGVMVASLKFDVKSKIRLRQSIRIYLKNILAKFHLETILNDGTLGFLKRSPQQQQQQQDE